MSAPWHIPNDEETLLRSLTNHRPSQPGIDDMKEVRQRLFEAGQAILGTLVESRYRSLALTALEECAMWSMKGIALDPNVAGTPDPLYPEES